MRNYAAAYLALVAALVYRAWQPAAAPAAPTVVCAPRRFGRCGAGCVKDAAGLCAPRRPSASPALPAAVAAPSTARADGLMRKRSVANCLAAADAYEAAAAAAPTAAAAAPLQLKAADALCCAMRTHGHGNILMLEGTLDTAENKRFWGVHGGRALELVRAARAAHAPLAADALAASVEMDAFMYTSSSKGILRQAVTGAGPVYLKLADALVSKHLGWDGAVGHGYLGGFYAVAPWPLGDRRRALREFETAYRYSPASKRNAYYVCLLQLQAADGAAAAKLALPSCEAAARGRCDGPTTPDYCGFLSKQVDRLLDLARARAA